MLSVIAGKDPLDNYTSAIPFDTIPDYAASCTAHGLKGARIGKKRMYCLVYTSDHYRRHSQQLCTELRQ